MPITLLAIVPLIVRLNGGLPFSNTLIAVDRWPVNVLSKMSKTMSAAAGPVETLMPALLVNVAPETFTVISIAAPVEAAVSADSCSSDGRGRARGIPVPGEAAAGHSQPHHGGAVHRVEQIAMRRE